MPPSSQRQAGSSPHCSIRTKTIFAQGSPAGSRLSILPVLPMSSAQATTRDIAWGTMPRMSSPSSASQPSRQPTPFRSTREMEGAMRRPVRPPTRRLATLYHTIGGPNPASICLFPGWLATGLQSKPRAATSGVCLDHAARRLAVRVMGGQEYPPRRRLAATPDCAWNG
jgi:hypothetical protein